MPPGWHQGEGDAQWQGAEEASQHGAPCRHPFSSPQGHFAFVPTGLLLSIQIVMEPLTAEGESN